ncbi:Clavaminate synthase-like protein [Aspergillus keveii]|uniref:Clavaminate synthase-like protein n=1 Tax=Aspergillus keveii TaxID=714993 RepID=A0ABR4G474_9EURO
MSDPSSVPQRSTNPQDIVHFTPRTYGDWRDEFHKYGCVVVKGVITPERAEYYRTKQIEWLKKFELGFDENDKSTWTAENLPCNYKGGMYFLYGATHENFVWKARMEPGVVDVFSKLWETDELIVAFDGFNISFPNRKDTKWSPWPHCDQSPKRKGMQAVQGLLNFAPNGLKDGGLILMKGAANLFDEFFASQRQAADHEDAPPAELEWEDLFLFSEEHVQWFKDHGCELTKINLDPGDMVLWDSRTMHYACLPEGDQIRHAQYICMTPRRFATPEALDLRKRCFEEYRGTTHWPHRNIHITSMKPMRGD